MIRRLLRLGCCVVPLLTCAGAAHALYFVRISDLRKAPVPPNPVKVAGSVLSVSPLRVTDGRAEISVVGLNVEVGDFIAVEGDWDGTTLAASQAPGKAVVYRTSRMPDTVYVPAGSFLMGNNGGEPYSFAIELPQHSVDLPAYHIGRCEATRAEYRQFIDAGGYWSPVWWSSAGWEWRIASNRTQPDYWAPEQDWHPSGGQPFTQTDRHPVVGVTYYEAEAFCNWAGGHLPTEAQWEKAARWTGSHSNVFPWGDVWSDARCNGYGDLDAAGGGYGRYQTAPVGSYPSGASPYGCQDMVGNVWEVCQDWCRSYPGSSSPFDYTGVYRVGRGGGYGDRALCGRSACRGYGGPGECANYCGFRLAR